MKRRSRKPRYSVTGKSAGRVLGSLGADRLRLVVRRSALNHVLAFSAEDRTCERGGVLVGDVDRTSEAGVEVTGFVAAVQAPADVGSLMFTHDTWVELNQEVGERFPGQRIVGWQHTHPGLGVFLSANDLFIHRNFFGQFWQIALVVDPVRQEFVFFQWNGADIVDCGFELRD